MKELAALSFPETNPDLLLRSQMLLLFDKISYYQPLPPEEPAPKTGILEKQGVSRGYSPVSLGTDAPRLRQLLLELKRYGGEFRGAALSAISSQLRQDRDEATVWSLTARMSRGNDRQIQEEEERQLVWQAVLLLKLAETYLEEDREIAAQLSLVKEKEAALFESLTEETAPAGSLGDAPEGGTKAPHTPLDYERLTRAWARLFIRDRHETPAWIAATSRPQAAGLVFDTYERLAGSQPVPLAQLSLPNLEYLQENEILSARALYRKARQETLTGLGQRLWESANSPEDNPAAGPAIDAIKEWEAKWHETDTPLPMERPWLLTIYCLPGLSLFDLFRRIGHDGKRKPLFPPPPHGMVAVIGQP